MEDAFIVRGGNKLSGKIRLSGAKNVALKAIIAALLFDSPVTLENVPRIGDVEELIHLIVKLGATVRWTSHNTLVIDPKSLKSNKVDLLHASKIRVSFMLFAPLLAHFKECFIPNPGGCRLGERPIGRIIKGMKALGVKVEYSSKSGFYEASMKQEPTGSFEFEKPSHTGTELLIMLSCLGTQQIVLKNAAQEPEIDELIAFLNNSGAQIKRDGDTILIKSVKALTQKKPHHILSDRNEAITFAVLAIASGGDITMSPLDPEQIRSFITSLKKAGAQVEEKGDAVRFKGGTDLKPVDIETSTHPDFMTDWQPNWAILMTQAHGKSIIHERVFTGRFGYVEELKKLGADIEFVDVDVKDPKQYYHFNYQNSRKYRQAIQITGPQKLHNGVLQVSDLRAGATLAIAALIAEGESVIEGASILERGYEDFPGKIASLGGNLKKI